MKMGRILVIDDKENILKVMRMILENEGHSVITASSGMEGLNMALRKKPDVIISDIKMPDMEGPEIFHILNSRGFTIPFIFITAYGSIKDAVTIIREGAIDYITKPVDYGYLKRVVARQIKHRQSMDGISNDRFLVGSSDVMNNLYKTIATVAESNSTVLIIGESGTGKELVARAIHAKSKRRNEQFVPVNCSAISTSLLESELFGHERGAFTGAIKQKKGLFEVAEGGTIFLDEVSEIAPEIQVKLLRVLQERAFTRVGGTELVNVDVRVIAATNRDLEELTSTGGFRRDLYYRLNVIPIKTPALREHLSDMEELVKHFVEKVCRREGFDPPDVDSSFIERLKLYEWPGNVRELENLIERLLILNKPRVLDISLMEGETSFNTGLVKGSGSERERIVSALRLSKGNKTETAKILGMPRRTLYHKIDRYGIKKEDYQNI